MSFRRLSHLFVPTAQNDWMRSHAANPVAEQVTENEFKVYFSPRDSSNRSVIASLDVVWDKGFQITGVSAEPELASGPAGSFDDCGTSMGSLVETEHGTLLYYLGWNLSKTCPFRNSIGVALRRKGEAKFEKCFAGPILDRSPVNPYSLSYPFVRKAGGEFQMWYGSHLTWGETLDSMTHAIRYATSQDGVQWKLNSEPVLFAEGGAQHSVSRPWVFELEGKPYLLFSYRGDHYEMGQAEWNENRWVRANQIALGPSGAGWDSDSVSYGSVFRRGDTTYLLYNGNEYGKTGFGIAEWIP